MRTSLFLLKRPEFPDPRVVTSPGLHSIITGLVCPYLSCEKVLLKRTVLLFYFLFVIIISFSITLV